MKWWLVVVAMAGVAVFSFWYDSRPYRIEDIGLVSQSATINKQTVETFWARDMTSRQQGLAGVEELDIDQALVLDFGYDGRHGIWMKGMVIAIDVLWLDSDGHVVAVENNVPIEPAEKTYRPAETSRYVIELNQQAIERYNIRLGDRVDLD